MQTRCLSTGRLRGLPAVLFCLGLLLPFPAGASRWKLPTEAEKQIVEDPSKGLVGAVFLEIQQESLSKSFRVRVRAKILSKNGFDVGTVENLAPDAYDIEGRTVGPSGKITELSKTDIRTMTTVKAGGVSLERKAFTLPALEPGCFIEYGYREYGALGSDSAYHTEILFQGKYPILKQELRTPKLFPFTSTVRNQNGVQVAFREESGNYLYSAANVPSFRSEPYGRPIRERAAVVILSYVFEGVRSGTAEEFWKSATKGVLTPMVKRLMIRPSRVEERLKKIEGSREQDPLARARAIYDYVQKNLRNTSVLRAGEAEPKGGWKGNDDAGDVLSHGAGSAIDLAMVYASLLRANGLKFQVVLAPDRESRFFRRDIPSVFQFGGWVIAVADPRDPSRVSYASFEHPLLPFGQVPWNHLGVDCWSVNPEEGNGTTMQIPESLAEQNESGRQWRVELSEEGDARVDRASAWSGQRAFEIRTELYRQGKEGWEKDLREQYQKLDPLAHIESVSWENEEKPDANLQGRLRFLRKGIANLLPGGRVEISPLTMVRQSNPFTRDERNDPILFPYPYRDQDTFNITPPAGYAADSLPQPIEKQSAAGRYVVRVQKGEGNAVVVTRQFELTRFWADPELYSAYRSLFEWATSEDAGLSLVFKKTAPVPKKTPS